jgi:DNA-binding MarR family transcriptional regulator
MMRLLHLMDAASAGRDTMELDLRVRRVVQALGLSGPAPIAAVSQRFGVSPSTMTGLADRLERRGYVRRRPHASDRRVTVLELTAKGERLFTRETDFYRRLSGSGRRPRR